MSSNDAPQPQELQTIDFELEQDDVYGKYMLTTPLDVTFILRSLLKRGCMSTVYFNQGRSFFLTWLLAIGNDEKSIILDISSDPGINREAVKATRLIVTANLDNIKIQFALTELQETTFEGKPAFLAAIPRSVLRLQRREYFRLETSVAAPLHCHVPIIGEDGSIHLLKLPLLDISGGGLGLMAPSDTVQYFNSGAIFQNCRLQIPDEGVLTVNLCIRNRFPAKGREGREYLRVGCEFANLPGARLNAIQRFITRVERERKAKLAGLN